MGLIRKPDASVFEDSTTVKVARGTREVAVEGGGALMQTASKLWLAMILVVFILTGFGAMVAAPNPARGMLALPFIAVAVWLLIRLFRPPTRKDAFETEPAWSAPLAAAGAMPAYNAPLAVAAPGGPVGGLRVQYWPKGLYNQASMVGIGGVILLMADGLELGLLTLLGVAFIARAVLIVSPTFGSRDCVVADASGLTVHSLLDKSTIALREIGDIQVKTFPRKEWHIAFTTGSRRHLVVVGLTPSGRKELLIPYTLLGLDQDGAYTLAGKLGALREQAVAPARPVPAVAPRQAARPAAEQAPLEGFDADAIMARYLAERAEISAASAMPPVAAAPAVRGFGRKGIARAG